MNIDNNKKIKILLISNMYPSKYSPSYGIFVKNFIDSFKDDFEFDLVVIRGREKSKFKKLVKYLKFYFEILKKGFFSEYNLIYVHYVSQVNLALLILWLFKKPKMILNYHGDDLVNHKTIFEKLMFKIGKFLAQKSELIVVPSNYFKNEAKNILEVDENKIIVYASGGIDRDIFKPLNKIECKKKLGFKENDFVLGFVGSIYKEKGYDLFIEAIAKLKNEIPNIKAIMVGAGIEEDNLDNLIRKYDLSDIIIKLKEIEHKKLPQIFNAMDLFIFPTRLKESLGLVGLEALACGVPVIGSKIGGLQDYIRDGENGYFFEVGNINDLVNKILLAKGKKFNINFDKSKIDKNIILKKLKGEMDMIILGIHDGHNASLALMRGGIIEYVIQEERLTKEKNKMGFPFKALELLFEKTNLSPNKINKVVLNGFYMPKPTNREGLINYYKSLLIEDKLLSISKLKNKLKTAKIIATPFEEINRQSRIDILKKLGFKKEQIEFINHHELHAASAYYGFGKFNEDILVLTNDGAGDRICATVNIGRNGKLEKIGEVHEHHSVANMYAIFTFLTGMVPLEHEYKLMGMAPYAKGKKVREIADEFWKMFKFNEDGLTWEFTKGDSVFGSMQLFKDFMFLKRFDHLMGGLQLFTEEFLKTWIKNAIKKTGIKKIACAGGIFMNVKANKVLMELEEVEEIFIFPSCGDESNAIGACYAMEVKINGINNIKPLEDIYFGIEWSDDEIKQRFENYNFKNYKYKIEKKENIEKDVAKLLASGYVVARFKGREEFGARALGNRSLLANPSKPNIIREINEMIKKRDFWMPFASSILDEDMDKYLNWESVKHKNKPYYMIMTYDTKEAAHTELAGGIHPYDKTVRPQMVTKKHNEDYWNLIKEFKRLTGIGGVLNTSLNLHGYPLVHEPEDAFNILENSSLKYLAIENWLVEKV